MNHGVYVSQQATSVSTPVVAESGVPFVVGLAPVQAADKPAAPGTPVLCTSWSEAVEKLGYSDDWATYTLCEFMYSHFKLFACQPVIFCNVLDIATAKEASAAADVAVTEHKVKLPIAAINDSALVIKPAGGTGSAYVSGTDYNAYYSGEHLVVELLSTGSAYDAEQVNIAYNKVKASTVTASDIASAMENVELCLTLLGIVPDLLCAPGYSQQSTVAAAMTAKAGNINGLFRAKALIDIGHAKSVHACASHGVLSGPAVERINSSAIEELALLNTIPAIDPALSGKIKYLSVGPMFSEAIERIYQETSISKLFR